MQARGQQPVVGLRRVPGAQGARQHVPLGVRLGLGDVDLAEVDELLDHRVVHADLLELLAVPPVHARVADVEHQPVRAAVVLGDGDARDGGAALASARELVADPRRGPDEARVHVVGAGGGLPGQLGELLDGDPARQVTGVVTAHAVGHQEHGRVGQERVLVDVAHEATIGRRTPRRSHLRPPSSPRDQATPGRVPSVIIGAHRPVPEPQVPQRAATRVIRCPAGRHPSRRAPRAGSPSRRRHPTGRRSAGRPAPGRTRPRRTRRYRRASSTAASDDGDAEHPHERSSRPARRGRCARSSAPAGRPRRRTRRGRRR